MRKRSKRRIRPVLANPMEFVLSGMQRLPQLKEQFLMLRIRNREALEQLRTGNATRDDIEQLIAMANMSEALAIHGKGIDWLAEIQESQRHLHALAQRGVDRGMRFVMKGPEWEALRFLADLHEAQLADSTVCDIEKAYDRVQKYLRAGHYLVIRTGDDTESA